MILDNPVDPQRVYAGLATAHEVLERANLPAEVEAVLLAGSFAHREADHLSDVDILVLAADKATHDTLSDWQRLEAVERPLRRHLDTGEVYANWIEPHGDRDFLRRDLMGARVLFSRGEDGLQRLITDLWPDGGGNGTLPVWGPEAQRATWLSRVWWVLNDQRDPGTQGRRALNLAHTAVRYLGLPMPDTVEGLAEVLWRAGIVTRREAEWVYWRYWLWRNPLEDHTWHRHDQDWHSFITYGADLSRDFAWHTLKALERRYFERMAAGGGQ